MNVTFDITEEELPIFLAEADEQMQILDEGLVQLEREAEDPELLQALFRAAHTLKGSAGMIGHKRLVELTHALEAALDGLRKGNLKVATELIDVCLETVDALRLLCEEVSQGETSLVDITLLVERLTSLAASGPAETPQTRAASSKSASKSKRTGKSPKGMDPLTIHAVISKDSIASAARAFQIILALQELGEILSMQPNQSLIETAAPVHEFTAQFVPANPDKTNAFTRLSKALSAISEIEQLSIEGQEIVLAQQSDPSPAKPAPRTRTETRLGDMLVQSGLISHEQLQTALRQQADEAGPAPLLGQALVRMGAITQEVLDEVVAEQKQSASPTAEGFGQEHPHHKIGEKTVRTSVERLDNLMNLVGELITDRNRLNLIRGELEAHFRGNEKIEAISETITHVARITDQLQAEVMGIRMLPISNVFNKFPRLVRDLARKANKQVDLVIRGEDTELDRSVIEVISDPLIHLLRNAVDHGIESPQERLAAGKPERGIILLTARHEQGRIILTVEDNGGGIDIQRVVAKAVEKGKIAKAEAEVLSTEEAIDLIFLSGLSTAKVVSDVSGRGVGMDIVRNNIERLNGSILVETWPGRGTQFQIVLPLTLAIVPTLLVKVAQGTYAVPLVTVTETLRLPVSEFQTLKGKPVIRLRDHVLPVVHLVDIFDIQSPPNGRDRRQHEYVVVVRSGKSQMGLIVDSLIGEEEVVVKSLSTVIGDVTGISSAAILGDGQVALILDMQGLFKLAYLHQQNGHKSVPPSELRKKGQT